MLISEFSRLTGLTRDTVRFYVRLGLFKPLSSVKGGRNPYQLFSAKDIEFAELIRVSQALGMSLKQIADLIQVRREGRTSTARSIRVLSERLALVEQRARQLDSMAEYLRAKIEWLRSGKGQAVEMPVFNDFVGEVSLPE
jgi:MerR family copper efflux transcriptional regulator